MKELLIIVAKSMSFDQIVEKLQESIDNYKEAKLLGKEGEEMETAIRHMDMTCHMMLINRSKDEPLDMIKKMDQMEKREKLFETGAN
jgi:hypothetical protein